MGLYDIQLSIYCKIHPAHYIFYSPSLSSLSLCPYYSTASQEAEYKIFIVQSSHSLSPCHLLSVLMWVFRYFRSSALFLQTCTVEYAVVYIHPEVMQSIFSEQSQLLYYLSKSTACVWLDLYWQSHTVNFWTFKLSFSCLKINTFTGPGAWKRWFLKLVTGRTKVLLFWEKCHIK